jgi:hypothetical protein
MIIYFSVFIIAFKNLIDDTIYLMKTVVKVAG